MISFVDEAGNGNNNGAGSFISTWSITKNFSDLKLKAWIWEKNTIYSIGSGNNNCCRVFSLNNRYSTQDAAEAVVFAESPDYLALEAEEVVRIKKLRIEGYYKSGELKTEVVEKKTVKKAVKQTEHEKVISKPLQEIVKAETEKSVKRT